MSSDTFFVCFSLLSRFGALWIWLTIAGNACCSTWAGCMVVSMHSHQYRFISVKGWQEVYRVSVPLCNDNSADRLNTGTMHWTINLNWLDMIRQRSFHLLFCTTVLETIETPAICTFVRSVQAESKQQHCHSLQVIQQTCNLVFTMLSSYRNRLAV